MTYDFGSADVQIGGSTITLLELMKKYKGIADTSQDTDLNMALDIAGQSIETFLDRVVGKRSVTEHFPHHFGTVILHDAPTDLSTPIVVTLDGDADDSYAAYLDRGKICHLSRIAGRHDVPMDWRKYEQVEVTYTAGFDPLPADLANAIVYTADLYFQSFGAGSIPGGGSSGEVKSVTVYDVGSVSYDVGSAATGGSGDGFLGAAGVIPDTAAQMLMRYKRISA